MASADVELVEMPAAEPSTPKSPENLYATTDFNGPSGPNSKEDFERLMASPMMQEYLDQMMAEKQKDLDVEKEKLAEEKRALEAEKEKALAEKAKEEEKSKKSKKGATKKQKKKKPSKRGTNTYSPKEAQQSHDEQISVIVGEEDEAATAEPAADKASFADAREVTLTRKADGGFGVMVVGGIETNAMPSIQPDANTLLGGQLAAEGELLLKANDRIVVGLLHEKLVEIFHGADEITLLVYRADKIPKCSDVIKLASHDSDRLTQQVAGAIRKAAQSFTTPYTTRPRREGEVDGREYHFVSVQKFEEMVAQDAFFEYSAHPQTGAYYGSPLPKVEEVKEAKHLYRHKSLKAAYKARANEATVGHILAGHDPKGVHATAIKDRIGPHTEDLSVSEFLVSVPEDDPTLAEARQRVKSAYYNLTCPYTTRPMREGEKNGREYNFVTVAEFKALLQEGRLLEYGVHQNHMYGTAKLGKDDARPDSPRRSEPSRSETLRQAAANRKDDATVGELLRFSSAALSKEHELVADKPVSEFLMSTDPNDPLYAGVRKQVKTWVYDCMIPYTTRPRRETEIEGREYHFVSDEQFDEMVKSDAFLEYGVHGGYNYGTPRVTEKHVHHSAAKPRHSRSKSMKAALRRRKDHVKVGRVLGKILEDGEYDKLELHGKAVGDLSVTEFLGSVDPDHPELAEPRRELKQAIWSMMVPYTTRPPREGELEGREYHFVSRSQFFDMLSRDMFVEHGARNGHLYGTPVPTAKDIEDHANQRSGGHMRMSLSAALVDELPELTVGHFHNLVDGGAIGVDHTMPVSKFFHHVEEDHPEFGELRDKIKAQILDMTVPYTTRPIRAGEISGVDYNFVTRDEFEEKINQQYFFEFGTVNGEYYGTPRVTENHLHPEDNTKPRRSRQAALQERIEAARNDGEITLGFFVENHEPVAQHPEMDNHRDVPLSVFFAHAAHGHEQHDDAISHIREVMYDMSTPYTTRPRREGERDGRDYHFITDEEFETRKANGDFLEFGTKNGYQYATPKLKSTDGEQPRSRKVELEAHFREHEEKHATVKEALDPSMLSDVEDRLHDRTIGFFLSKTSVDDPRYAAIRAKIKAAVYAASVPWTTRPPRPHEVQDDHYHFCSKEEFDAAVDEDKFLEWGQNNGHYYGTLYPSKEQVDENGGLRRRRPPRQSTLDAVDTSGADREVMKMQLDRDVNEKLQLLDTIKGKLANTDEAVSAEELLNQIHALVHDETTPLPPRPVVSPSEDTVALEQKIQAQQTELQDQKDQLQRANEEREKLQKDLDQTKEDMDMLRTTTKQLNTALAMAQAAPGLKPDEVKAIVDASRAVAAQPAPVRPTPVAAAAPDNAVDGGQGAAAPWSSKNMSALKAKMAARRWGNKALANAESEEDMSPLKRKLMERRKAKLAAEAAAQQDTEA
eukprot:m.435689 g.435689  ORF g.435689 m.435689 type:complete len:1419 (+) comp17879_c0_seq1:186-4442(+)